MMKIIAHRGNIQGPIPARENAPDYVDEAIAAGFDVEVDLRMVGKDFYLGHDFPLYPVSADWISKRSDRLLIHLKDFASLRARSSLWHTFCHSRDTFTFTSRGYIWLHDLSITPDSMTLVPLITKELRVSYPRSIMGGICTDFCST